MLRAFGDQMLEGVLLFRADGQLIMANAIARQSLCKEDPTDDRNLGERISQVLPADALNQARSKGTWTGSLPVSDRVVIAHLYYNEEQGVGHFWRCSTISKASRTTSASCNSGMPSCARPICA